MKENVILTYENILQGRQKAFSPYFFQKQHRMEKVGILIRYLVEEKLKLTPEEALEKLTLENIKNYKLKPIIKYVDKPIEYSKDEVKHLVYFAFPTLGQPTQKDLALYVYKEVLDEKRKNFPKNYFLDGGKGEERASICFRYLCEEILKLPENKIAETFLNGKGNNILTKYKLKIIVSILFLSMVDLLETVYPNILKEYNSGDAIS